MCWTTSLSVRTEAKEDLAGADAGAKTADRNHVTLASAAQRSQTWQERSRGRYMTAGDVIVEQLVGPETPTVVLMVCDGGGQPRSAEKKLVDQLYPT